MSLTEKKELRCKIDTCIWHEQYIWSNKKAITQSSVVANRYEMLRPITKYVFCKVGYSFRVTNLNINMSDTRIIKKYNLNLISKEL